MQYAWNRVLRFSSVFLIAETDLEFTRWYKDWKKIEKLYTAAIVCLILQRRFSLLLWKHFTSSACETHAEPRMGVSRGVVLPTPFRFSGEVSCRLSRPLQRSRMRRCSLPSASRRFGCVSESACTMRVCVRAYVFVCVRACVCDRFGQSMQEWGKRTGDKWTRNADLLTARNLRRPRWWPHSTAKPQKLCGGEEEKKIDRQLFQIARSSSVSVNRNHIRHQSDRTLSLGFGSSSGCYGVE